MASPPQLSVVIPAFRESARIASTLTKLRDALVGEVEIIVVDDGSGDATSEAASTADQVITFPTNKGKGAAVRAGLLAATGDVVVFTDADLAYPPAQIPTLVTAIEAGAEVVIGNRRHTDTVESTEASNIRSFGSKVVRTLTSLLGLCRFPDSQCGLKAFRREAAQQLASKAVIDGFAFDVELLFLASKADMKIAQVPVEVVNSESSSVHVVRHGIALAKDLLRIRLRWLLGSYKHV